MFAKNNAPRPVHKPVQTSRQDSRIRNIQDIPSRNELGDMDTSIQKKNLSNPEIGLWTKEDTIEKYAYMNILGNPRIIRLRKANKEFNEDFSYYYSLLEDIAENMIEFRIYWDMMLKLLRKYDII